MNYEMNFSEQDIRLIYEENTSDRADIRLIYEENTSDRADIRVLQRYKTKNGYMALVFLYERHCLFFVDKNYLRFQTMEVIGNITDLGAAKEASDIAHVIGAELLS